MRWSAVVCWLTVASSAWSGRAAAQDYTFDTSGLESRPYDLSASIELWPTFAVFHRGSPLYLLRYGEGAPSYSTIYRLRAETGAQYKLGSFLGSALGVLSASYEHFGDSLSSSAKFYECYLKYSPRVSFSLLAGKKTFRWGKGYAYNPVSFASRPRDLNDIDAPLEGYWNVSAELIRGFSKGLSAFALSGALFPVHGALNEGLEPGSDLVATVQAYALLYDTDLDVIVLGDNEGGYKTGLDFSKNLLASWEIHGEWAYLPDNRTTFFANETTLVTNTRDANNLVLGTRYLALTNTTFILEYIHQGSGFTSNQMGTYYRVLGSAQASENATVARATLESSMNLYNRQFIMTDYVYLRASQPDPFMLLYLTPAAYALLNLLDGSAMVGVEMTYTRFRHLLLTARCVAFVGSHDTEFGVKQARGRIELRGEWSF
jgi:hypothetical protein